MVSVIIPNYNHAQYLDRRIQSVLNQTYNDFELIILDDQSTDNSAEVIYSYKDNPRISVIDINEKNSGSTFKQWEKGFGYAKGKYIWIAESDDFCEPNLLEELVGAIESDDDIAYSFSPVIWVDEKGTPFKFPKVADNIKIAGKAFLSNYMILGNYVLNASCALFKKDIYHKIDKQYKNLKGGGDYLFWVEMAKHGSVVMVNKHLSYWRRHEGAVTEKCFSNGTNFYAEKFVVDNIAEFLDCNNGLYSLVHDSRLFRINNTQFVSDTVKNDVSRLWDVTSRFDFDEDFDSIKNLLWKIEFLIRYEHFKKSYQDSRVVYRSSYVAVNEFVLLREKSFRTYIYCFICLFLKLGYKCASDTHNRVCIIRGVRSNLLMRLYASIMVYGGGIKNKLKSVI